MSAQQPDFIDYYLLLGVSCDESIDKIKKAYRKVALKKHPDKNPDNPNAAHEFAILVEAKEILTNKVKRMKYDNDYKERKMKYEHRLEKKKKDEQRRSQMNKIRQQGINDLLQREKRAKEQQRAQVYKNYHYDITKQQIREEMERVRQELQQKQEQKLNDKIKEVKRIQKEEKLKKRCLTIKLDKSQCDKPYSRQELQSIFKIYGKIDDIHMKKDSKYGGAQIVFSKSKYALKALDDEQTLRDQFYLIVINNYHHRKTQKTMDDKW
eukprot:CAMPEP_0201565598 /NCGR_PEP_ID=MMETSP0190_2-20130828/4832_1 /ASSEMBLY_ACC=CAM_ASM_000263 /TAXON_ID=37353 /ORGANISM="Rosalina sp." /LENGTH=265 /DNA_ID=CAMNT_0047983285 /DNA_START=21 /DNA_END=815 /DNA_ORIENTATION=+